MSNHPTFSVLALAALVTLVTVAGLYANPATAQSDSEGCLGLSGGLTRGQIDEVSFYFSADLLFGFDPSTGQPDSRGEHATPKPVTCLQADRRIGVAVSGSR